MNIFFCICPATIASQSIDHIKHLSMAEQTLSAFKNHFCRIKLTVNTYFEPPACTLLSI